ncbi:MAG: ABC transporter substrate-binding protein [Syntrophorhabdaceae bacterium]
MNRLRIFLGFFLALTLLIPQATTAGDLTRIGISTIIQHPALDDVVRGFKDELAARGYKEGSTVQMDYRNAQGSLENAVQIAAGFVGNKVDLILAVSTPIAKVSAEQTKSIPIVIAAVTDPVGTGLVKDPKHPGENVTGVSDMVPVEEQFKLVKRLIPKASRIGVIYNSGEPNSVIIIGVARNAAKKLNLTLIEATVNKTSDVRAAAASLVGKIDVMYLTTDNTTAAAIDVINDVCNENAIPFVSSEKESLKSGTLAFLGVNYYEHGKDAGNIAARILKGEKAGNIAILYPKKFDIAISKKVAYRYKINIPADIVKEAEMVQ